MNISTNRASRFIGLLILLPLLFAAQVFAANIGEDEDPPQQPPPPTTGPATVSVNSNMAATWTVNPGSFTTYNSTSGSNTVTVSSNGTAVSVGPGYKSGYTASCSPSCSQVAYPGDVLSFQITYTPSEGQPVISFTANPQSIAPEGSSTLSWSVTSPSYGEKSCKTNWDGQIRGASGSLTVSPTQTTTYSITCTNTYTIDPNTTPYTYSSTASTLVTVESRVSDPTGVIYEVVPAGDKTISKGSSLAIAGTFEWANVLYVASFDITVTRETNNSSVTLYSKNYCFNRVQGCTWTDGAGSTSYSGEYRFDQPGVYEIRYHGLAKTSTGAAAEPVVTRKITVENRLYPPEDDPTASLTANPTSLATGQSTTFSYSCGNSTRATASWSSNWLPTSGTYTTSYSQSGNHTHYVSCYNDLGNYATAQATVSVTSSAPNTLSVSSNVASDWTVSASSGETYRGSGLSSSHSISPSPSGTTYTIGYGWPSGYCSVFVRNSVTGDARPMTLTSGQSGSFSLEYLPCQQPQGFNYSLSNSGNVSVVKGSQNAFGQSTVTKTLTSGDTESVSISASGMPSGVSVSYANRTCSPTCSSTITFTVSPNAPVGTYPITVTGSPLGRTTSFNLVISGSPISVSCTADPASALVGQPVSWTAAVTGGTAPYSYSWSGTSIPTSPAPTSNPFSITYSTLGQKTAVATVTDAGGQSASCNPAGTVQVNFTPKFEEF